MLDGWVGSGRGLVSDTAAVKAPLMRNFTEQERIID